MSATALTPEQVALIARSEGLIRGALRRYGLDRDEDAIQEARIRLMQAVRDFDPRGTTWARWAWRAVQFSGVRAATRWARDTIPTRDGRRTSRLLSMYRLEVDDSGLDEMVEWLPTDCYAQPVEPVEPLELSLLTPAQRYAVELVQQGWTAAEIAEQRGTSRQAVSFHIGAACRRMAQRERRRAIGEAIRMSGGIAA